MKPLSKWTDLQMTLGRIASCLVVVVIWQSSFDSFALGQRSDAAWRHTWLDEYKGRTFDQWANDLETGDALEANNAIVALWWFPDRTKSYLPKALAMSTSDDREMRNRGFGALRTCFEIGI